MRRDNGDNLDGTGTVLMANEKQRYLRPIAYFEQQLFQKPRTCNVAIKSQICEFKRLSSQYDHVLPLCHKDPDQIQVARNPPSLVYFNAISQLYRSAFVST